MKTQINNNIMTMLFLQIVALMVLFSGCASDAKYNRLLVLEGLKKESEIGHKALPLYETNDIKLVIEGLYLGLFEYQKLQEQNNYNYIPYESIYGIDKCRLGFVYDHLGQKELAQKYYEEALQHFKNGSNDAMTNITVMKNRMHNFDKGLNPLWKKTGTKL